MPWNMKDYPDSFKNFDTALKKKAIDIANAMIDDGYSEDRAIPIATEQAKKWHDNASEHEIEDYKQHGKPSVGSEADKENTSRPELLYKTEQVVKHEKGWAVQAKDAKKPSDIFESKKEAVQRAKEIAKNKGTEAVVYKEDGSVQERTSYTSNK